MARYVVRSRAAYSGRNGWVVVDTTTNTFAHSFGPGMATRARAQEVADLLNR